MLGVSPATVLDRRERGDLPGFKLWNGPVRFRESGVGGPGDMASRAPPLPGRVRDAIRGRGVVAWEGGGGCRASAGDSYASWAIAAGIGLFGLSRLMGTSVEQIDTTYGHLLPDSLDRARAALEAFGHGAGTDTAMKAL
jgi:hypothetical protein